MDPKALRRLQSLKQQLPPEPDPAVELPPEDEFTVMRREFDRFMKRSSNGSVTRMELDHVRRIEATQQGQRRQQYQRDPYAEFRRLLGEKREQD